METVTAASIEWGVAARPLFGEKESGDGHLVQVGPKEALVAVVDGLGHGEEAAAATRIAIATLKSNRGDSSVALVRRCCDELRFTRGVVMSLACLDLIEGTVTWIGVGNVEGVVLHWDGHTAPRQAVLLLRPGVIGDREPRLLAATIPVAAGDLLIFATDGIRPGFAEKIHQHDPPQQIADRILAEYGQATDDALVMVVRYLHGPDNTSQ